MKFVKSTHIVDSHSLGLAMLNVGNTVAKDLDQLLKPCPVFSFLKINSPASGGP